MQFLISKWHYIPRQQFPFYFKQFNRLLTNWYMATCHPHVIFSLFSRLVLNVITVIVN